MTIVQYLTLDVFDVTFYCSLYIQNLQNTNVIALPIKQDDHLT